MAFIIAMFGFDSDKDTIYDFEVDGVKSRVSAAVATMMTRTMTTKSPMGSPVDRELRETGAFYDHHGLKIDANIGGNFTHVIVDEAFRQMRSPLCNPQFQ